MKSASDFDLPLMLGAGSQAGRRDLKRLLIIFGSAIPLLAQYAGPAILSRGDAPAAMAAPQISFRPFVEVTGVYDSDLAGVAINPQGQLPSSASEGIQVAFGISGSHSWRHTQIGLDYHGDVTHYNGNSFYDSTDHALLLGIKHQFTRHISFSLRNSAGLFSINTPNIGLPQTVPFDPSQSFIPSAAFFNNRTIYANTMADLVIQKSSRLSFALGGGGFLTQYRSGALYGLTGATARADVQYRLTRRSTIGADYNYTHFSFNNIFSSTDINGADLSYAVQLSQRLEFSGFGGFSRVETKFIQSVPLDPAIAAILGVSTGERVSYSARYVPNINARLSRTFSRGVIYLSGGHTIIPGNGLFLTSTSTAGQAGYTYTGLRRWSFNASVGYAKNGSIGNVVGTYGGGTATVSMSRQISRGVHTVASFTAQRYNSGDFSQYNRTIYYVRLGIGFAPGDVPIRIW